MKLGVHLCHPPSYQMSSTAPDITSEIRGKVGEMNRAPKKTFTHSSLARAVSVATLDYTKALGEEED